MNIASLIEKNNYYICSNCRMQQQNISSECSFCGVEFTNFSSILYKINVEKEKELYQGLFKKEKINYEV